MIGVRTRGRLVAFDRSVIRRNWNAINETPLKRAGLLVRGIARGSIRRQPNKRRYSRPDRPPRSHQSGKTPPFKMIYSVPEQLGSSVIVGMVGFGGSGEPVPGLHEHGGSAKRSVMVWKTRHKRDGRRGPVLEFVRKTVRYPKRPFMLPALEKGKAKMPQLWRNAVKEKA